MTQVARQVRFFWRVARAFLGRHKKTIFLGIVSGAVFSLIVTLALPRVSLPKTPVRIGMVGSYTSQTLPEFIQRQITVGMTQVDENQEVKPGLATSWQASDEGKVWIFKLGGGINWQDGSQIKASDINYGFSDVEITGLSQNEISFRLKDPFAPLPAVVSKPVFKRGLLGVGPYEVSQFRQTSGNIDYLYLAAKGKDIPDMLYRFYPTEMMAKTAFKLGAINKLIEMADTKEFNDWKNVKIEPEIHRDRYVAIFFNTQDSQLENKSIRQALAYGLKKVTVGQERVISPIHPDSWAYNSQVKTYDYNVEKAKKLLSENMLKGKKMEINLVALPSLLEEAEKVKVDWEELGVKVHLQVSNFPPENYQAILVTQLVGPDPDQYSLWHSTQKGSNLSRYANLRIDQLLESGRKTLDKEKRKEIYFDFQRFLIEDCPAIFLYHPITYAITRE